ncbi:MAG TPA: aldose epimerase family protein [Croceibacterium sp.]
MLRSLWGLGVLLAAVVAAPALAADAQREAFGALPDGRAVEAVVLSNDDGMRVRVIAWGAIVQELTVPGNDGPADVVLGYDAIEGYLADGSYIGATVGRYANRIAGARFTLDGREYPLAANNGANSLHGGLAGFDKQLWAVTEVRADADSASVTLVRRSPAGEEGFPGNLDVSATFALTESGELQVTYRATTDAPTVVNMTNHSYFNLAGEGSGRSAEGHLLTIPAESYTPAVDGIPTGEIRSVAGTPFDFRTPRRVGDRVRDGRDEQLRSGRGYDHNWVVSRAPAAGLQLLATVEEPVSGRVMQVLGNQPGVQLYAANHLNGTAIGKGGVMYRQGDAICLEPQLFPDTPNQPAFGSARLDPGETYEHRIVYRFAVRS